MLFLDSETVGFCGPPILFQYAIDEGDVVLYDFWDKSVNESIKLLEMFCEHEVCAFNITFDWFHVVKAYNTLINLKRNYLKPGMSKCPPDPELYWKAEADNFSEYCLKPKASVDLMLYCQSGPYQYLMDRKDIFIRYVPKALAEPLLTELEARIPLKQTLNAKWKIEQSKTYEGRVREDFVNIVLRFKPSKSLESISQDVLGEGKAPSYFKELPKPEETPWRPYGGPWLDVFADWLSLWTENKGARYYAEKDVTLLQELYNKFNHPMESIDDRLAILAANTRWRGYSVDVEQVKKIIEEQQALVKEFPVNLDSPAQLLEYLKEGLSDIEAQVLTSTKKTVLEHLAKKGNQRARDILVSRKAQSRIRLFHKFLNGKFHASVKVIGALSGRQSGADKLNPQGIPSELRYPFTMAYEGEILQGGDFDAFEVSIADAVYNDDGLRELLLSGKKVHGIFGESITGIDYDKIMATKDGTCYECHGTGEVKKSIDGNDEALDPAECSVCNGTGVDKTYTSVKSGFFGFIYGAQAQKIGETVKISTEAAEDGLEMLKIRFPGIGRAQKRTFDKFCSMRQPEEFGKVMWHEPADFEETLLGFRRYFTIENKICKALYELANNPPKEWKAYKVKVERRKDRMQTVCGAVQSAVFGAAFGIQAQNMRAAGNHVIQGTGAGITKAVQDAIWGIQPTGPVEWLVRPLNIHDELQTVTKPGVDLTQLIQDKIEEYKPVVPLLSMGWNYNTKSWAESK